MSDISSFPDSSAYSEAAIFARAVESFEKLPAELAELMLSLKISEKDQRRVYFLLERNSAGLLSSIEKEELENLNHVADLLSVWHSRARRALKNS